jgi:hypothetical protein
MIDNDSDDDNNNSENYGSMGSVIMIINDNINLMIIKIITNYLSELSV